MLNYDGYMEKLSSQKLEILGSIYHLDIYYQIEEMDLKYIVVNLYKYSKLEKEFPTEIEVLYEGYYPNLFDKINLPKKIINDLSKIIDIQVEAVKEEIENAKKVKKKS